MVKAPLPVRARY